VGLLTGLVGTEVLGFGVARLMQRMIFERPVVDEPGLKGRYTFDLRWQPDEVQFDRMRGLAVLVDEGSETRDDIYTAARRQLGLKIQAKRTMVDVMVIDAATQPLAN